MVKASSPQNSPSGITHQPSVSSTILPVPAPALPFGPNPQVVTCPSCHNKVVTTVKAEASSQSHMTAAVLCVAGFGCCLPYRMDSCQNRNHYCENCGAFLGTYTNN